VESSYCLFLFLFLADCMMLTKNACLYPRAVNLLTRFCSSIFCTVLSEVRRMVRYTIPCRSPLSVLNGCALVAGRYKYRFSGFSYSRVCMYPWGSMEIVKSRKFTVVCRFENSQRSRPKLFMSFWNSCHRMSSFTPDGVQIPMTSSM
jgi:hypothetical protein